MNTEEYFCTYCSEFLVHMDLVMACSHCGEYKGIVKVTREEN